MEANLLLLKHAVDQGMPLIYVMAKRPFKNVRDALDKIGACKESNAFIDAITKTIGAEQEHSGPQHITYVQSPQDLTNISTAISAAYNHINRDNILLVVDSLDSLLTYNTERSLSRFFEDLSDRIKTLDTNIVFFYTAQTTLSSRILQYIDDTVLLNKDTMGDALVNRNADRAVVTLPEDVAMSMGWKDGEKLEFTVTDEDTLELRKR